MLIYQRVQDLWPDLITANCGKPLDEELAGSKTKHHPSTDLNYTTVN